MATASTGHEPGKLECSVCHELLTTPKLLPCGHHLCRHCLVTWLQHNADARCPLCRCPIIQGQNKATATEAVIIADSFPTDLFMEKVMEEQRLLDMDHQCRVCEDVVATALCLQCADMLCSSCKKAHKKLSVSKNHTVEDLASLTAETLARKRPSACEAHPEEPCKLYCPSHATSICWLCASTKHRACSNLTELSEKMDEAGEVLESLVNKLKTGEWEIDQAMALLDQHWEKTEHYISTALAEIGEMRLCLESSVNAWEQRLKKQMLDEREYIKASVEEAKEHLLQRRGKLSTHRAVVEQGKGMRNRDIVDKMAFAMESRVEELDHTKSLPDDAKVVSALELTLDKEGLSRFEQELCSLGKVWVSPADNIGIVKPTTLRFCNNHGYHIKLNNFQQTATKSGQYNGGGIVLALDPLKQNFLYEVQIVYDTETKSKQRRKLKSLTVGAVTEAPDTIDIPDISPELHDAFAKKLLMAHPAVQIVYDSMTESKQPGRLESLTDAFFEPAPEEPQTVRAGDRVGMCLDSNHSLHLYVNGQQQGEAIATEVPQPCYAMFDLRGKAGQITALPVAKVMTS